MQGPFVSSPRSGCEQHRETHQRTCDSSCSFHEISISVNLRSRVKQIQPLAGKDTSRRFLFRALSFGESSATAACGTARDLPCFDGKTYRIPVPNLRSTKQEHRPGCGRST